MSTPQIERLREQCHRLRLYQIENELTARLEQAVPSAGKCSAAIAGGIVIQGTARIG